MTIDEAIKHCLEVAEEREDNAEGCENLDEWTETDYFDKEKCLQCAADHRQLAEWLTELRQWRRVYGICPSYEMCIPECKEGYNEQIAEYKRLLKAAIEEIWRRDCDTCESKVCKYCFNNELYKWRYEEEAKKLIGGINNDNTQ